MYFKYLSMLKILLVSKRLLVYMFKVADESPVSHKFQIASRSANYAR